MNVDSLKMYVAYNEIAVRDSTRTPPAFEWNEELFMQGFARQESFVALVCMLDSGPLYVQLLDRYQEDEWVSCDRIISMPFVVQSGSVCLENAEDPKDHPQASLRVSAGWYDVYFGQTLDEQREILTGKLAFVPANGPTRGCRIIRHEDPQMLDEKLIEHIPDVEE